MEKNLEKLESQTELEEFKFIVYPIFQLSEIDTSFWLSKRRVGVYL